MTRVLHTAKINNVERLLRVNRIRKIVNTKFGGEMEKYVFFELLDKGKVLYFGLHYFRTTLVTSVF